MDAGDLSPAQCPDEDLTFVLVALTDDSGRLLLQERDEHAHVFPEQWGLPGGAREPGESALVCGLRELVEETGIDDVELTELGRYVLQLPGRTRETFAVLHGSTPDRVPECHEGRQMVFTDPEELLGLPLAAPLARAVGDILAEPGRVARHGAVPWREGRFAGVLLVDAGGRLLLQERDEHPVIDPERWGLPGGHVEPGEEFEAAAHRELEEETGVRLAPGSLTLVHDLVVDHRAFGGGWDRMQVYAALVDATDADIDCREGRQMVFVDPATTTTLPLSTAAAVVVPGFLSSPEYASMVG